MRADRLYPVSKRFYLLFIAIGLVASPIPLAAETLATQPIAIVEAAKVRRGVAIRNILSDASFQNGTRLNNRA